MKYFDTHCHLTNHYFDGKLRDDAIKEATLNGVGMILIPGTDEKDSREIQKYKTDTILVGAGVHPSDVTLGSSKFLNDLDVSNLSAVGEIGIDLHYDDNPDIDIQISEFEYQLDFAVKHNLPAIIHMRDAEKEVYACMSKDKYKELKFVMHSYTSTLEWANKFIELGGYISLSGIVTFKNAKELQEVAKALPLNKILIETDSPYLAPMPNRGKSNKPEYVKHVGDFLAEIRTEDEKIVLETIYNNSIKLFCNK